MCTFFHQMLLVGNLVNDGDHKPDPRLEEPLELAEPLEDVNVFLRYDCE